MGREQLTEEHNHPTPHPCLLLSHILSILYRGDFIKDGGMLIVYKMKEDLFFVVVIFLFVCFFKKAKALSERIFTRN